MEFEFPPRITEAPPDADRVAKMRRQFAEGAQPARPLPSNGRMMLACVGIFAVLAIVIGMPLGLAGFLKMSLAARLVNYTIILLLAMVLAGGVVEQMIPGSRRVMQPGVSVAAAIVLLSLISAMQFPEFAMEGFVPLGIPCLRAGVLCSIPAGFLTWAMMRQGFVLNRLTAGVAGGAFAGLLGFAVLALHCPIHNGAHIIVWHIGAILITTVAGALIGSAAAVR